MRRGETRDERRQRVLEDRQRYDVGRHIVRLLPEDGGWAVSVDGLRHGRRHATAAEAWSVGLQTAEGLERAAAAGSAPRNPGGRGGQAAAEPPGEPAR